MNRLDLTLPTPAENLACEEALLDGVEAGGAPVLRFWEPASCFVVVGYANRVAAEVNMAACAAAGVPILRRCSGGGTVLQTPGCLNYALVLPSEPGGPLDGITAANRFIMERHRAALAAALGAPVAVQGHTDLTLAGRKFSGNSQRRRPRALLFHGCLLLRAVELEMIERCLRLPSQQPAYRQGRPHGDFLTRLDASPAEVKAILARAWEADAACANPVAEATQRLAREKYATAAWTFRL